MTDGLSVAISGTNGGFPLDVAFDAPGRGVTILFGPSGSGKTSVLRAIAGLDPVAGSVRLGKTDFQSEENTLPAHRRGIGYVFQKPGLFPHMTVRQNLMYGARRRGSDPGSIATEMDTLLSLFEIGPILKRLPRHLSGGEAQRVAIGRAMMSGPDLLLMDEPLSALDRKIKDKILTALERYFARSRVPALYVTHDLSEAMRLGTHMVLIDDGRVVASGPLEELLSRMDLGPLLGRFQASSQISATVTGHDTGYHLTRLSCGGQTVSVPLISADPGDRIKLRIRVRDVSVATEAPGNISIQNILKVTIGDIRPEPQTPFAEVLTELGDNRIKARITRESADRLNLSKEMPVWLLIKSISFDGQPGRNPSATQ